MVFEEVQRFRQWWLWLILIGTTLIPVYGLYQQVYLGIPFGNNPASDEGLVVFLLLMLALLVLFAFTSLRTRIDDTGIKMVFIPFKKKTVAWDQVEQLRIVNYGFVGGWGIRLGSHYGTIYNISGNKGLAIRLKNGKKFLIGTAQPEALKSYLKKYRSPYL
jgi:hypothetical protein